MLAMGIDNWYRKPPPHGNHVAGQLAGAYLSALLLTITNPTTIFAFAAIFAAFDVVSPTTSYRHGLELMIGVLVGASAWWIGLTLLVSLFRHGGAEEEFRWLYRLSGVLLIGFGIAALGSIFLV